jgi:hypothetical protein
MELMNHKSKQDPILQGAKLSFVNARTNSPEKNAKTN